jgi:hypothetical protein
MGCRLDEKPPVKLPFTERLLQMVLPAPSTEKGYVVPLKTLKPPPIVARNPDEFATIPVEVTAVEFTEPTLMDVAARSPKVPVAPTLRLLAVKVVKLPVAPVHPFWR